jgi:hypothetical protein
LQLLETVLSQQVVDDVAGAGDVVHYVATPAT